ncbi:hypothetical protein [Methanorbis furvi]|uniref:Uncharacterized protein n=1 Tax=Methanorbis furvi TaxID=3028299 RepID=A0AAE4MC98_9EURY|nr:hypothetical protein [Methanocorpusculaceae archaeon Ag1]
MKQNILTSHPFPNPNSHVSEEIMRYMTDLAGWLVGASEYSSKYHGKIFMLHSNAYWEAASAGSFLIKFDKISYTNKLDRELNIDTQILATLRWIFDNKEICCDDGDEQLYSNAESFPLQKYTCYRWDGNVWNTSCVLQFIFDFLKKNDTDIPNEITRNELKQLIYTSLRWIELMFLSNDPKNNPLAQNKYALYSSNFSKTLILLLHLSELESSTELDVYKKWRDNFIHEIIEKLIEDCKWEDGDKQNMCRWETYVKTADCGLALAEYYDTNVQIYRTTHHNYQNIHKCLIGTCRWLEEKQTSTGTWGSQDDTIRSAHAYLQMGYVLNKYQSIHLGTHSSVSKTSGYPYIIKPYRIFKALRTLVDAKQYPGDGSIIHTPYLTLFFSEFLLSLYETCQVFFEKSMYKLYDDVLTHMPLKATKERGDVLRLKAENHKYWRELRTARTYRRTLFILNFIIGLYAIIGIIIW